MSVLVTADIHLTDTTATPRDAYRHQAMTTIADIAINGGYSIDTIIILGDLTEEKDNHGAWLTNKVVEHLSNFAHMCPVIVLMGNHDFLREGNPFFSFVNRIPGIHWIDKPIAMSVPSLGDNCLFLPHTRNYKRDWKDIKLSGHDQVFAHNTFTGASSEHGYELDGIPRAIFPDIRHYVISGDVHTPQRVDQITYVGAPYLIDFGDNFEPRVLLLREGHLPKSIPVPGPQKRLIEATSDLVLLENSKPPHPGDIVKMRITLKEGEYASWADIREYAREWVELAGATLYTIAPLVEKQTSQVRKQKRATPKTDEQILTSYSKRLDVDDRTLETGFTLMHKGG